MPHPSKRESNKPTVAALFQAAGQTLGSVAVPSPGTPGMGNLAGASTEPDAGKVHPTKLSQSQSQSHAHAQHHQQAQQDNTSSSSHHPSLATSLYTTSSSTFPHPHPLHPTLQAPGGSASSTPSQASYELSASVSPNRASQALHLPPPVPTYVTGTSSSRSGGGGVGGVGADNTNITSTEPFSSSSSFTAGAAGPSSGSAANSSATMSQSQHFATQSRAGSYAAASAQMPPVPQGNAWESDELHMSGAGAPANGHQQHPQNPPYGSSYHASSGSSAPTNKPQSSASSSFLPSSNLQTSPTSFGPSASSSAGPRIKLEESSYPSSSSTTSHQQYQQYQTSDSVDTAGSGSYFPQTNHPSSQHYQGQPSQTQLGSVPSILQPAHGNSMASRPPNMSANSSSQLPTLQTMGSPQQQHSPQPSQGEYSASSKPSLSLASHSHPHSHGYSRSSPATNFDSPSSYMAYTPTTPGGGPLSSQYMSPPTDQKYGAPGSQRNISNTPLGLADIRPRTDSSLSDGTPGTLAYELANAQPGTSNYLAPWAIYAFDWCQWKPQGNSAGKVAVGSYLEDGHNFIQILDTKLTPTPSDAYQAGSSKHALEFTRIAEATHSYPVTRLLWEPPSTQKQSTDLLATSGDHLRLWSLPSDAPMSATTNSVTGRQREMPVTKLTPLALLSNSKTPDHTAPLTSLDWNTVSPSLIITSSIDTTCTIWDIPSLTAKTQLIAHDKEVYDVRFCANSVDVFVSCGQDGSVRMFDLRSLEHSTIIYEPTGKDDRVDSNGGRVSPTLAQQTMAHPPPLLRLATSPHDTHLLATFAQDSNVIRILDVRQPGQALLELRGHGGSVNCVEWSPNRRGTLASGGDDSQVHIWDIMTTNGSFNMAGANGVSNPDAHRAPVASWQCDYEVGNVGWVPRLPGESGDWLGVSGGRGVWGVRI
ncbi:hypothetical protein MKZ38_006414 [Zalerion maritima]|uniref:Uncharacterized protein n=1 Tax=Zalerion maritima TaxID=339359 RepID=A0AAD5RK01_9PEZI|nr:hypothetical protein MKZ38_006414 [Zalerion maritima]